MYYSAEKILENHLSGRDDPGGGGGTVVLAPHSWISLGHRTNRNDKEKPEMLLFTQKPEQTGPRDGHYRKND